MLLAVVLAGGAVAWVLTQQTHTAPQLSNSSQANIAAGGMTAAIDPVTKQLRPLTAEEANALGLGAKSAQVAAIEAQQIVVVSHPGGMKSIRLPESYMETVTVRKQADGSLSYQCASEKDKPQSAARPATSTATSNLEEK